MKFIDRLCTKKFVIVYLVASEIIGFGACACIFNKILRDGRGRVDGDNDKQAFNLGDECEARNKLAEGRIFRLEQEVQNLKWLAMDAAAKQPCETLQKDAHRPTLGQNQSGAGAGEERDFEIASGVTIRMCWIPPGQFVMGSPADEIGRRDDQEEPHDVVIRNGFWMAKTELTQKQWRVAGGLDTSGRPPDSINGTSLSICFGESSLLNNAEFRADDMPIERIGWTEAKAWCIELTQRQHAGGILSAELEYNLPTEAEWEYACRAGTQTAINNGGNLTSAKSDSCESLDDVAWYHGNSGDTLHAVGLKKPNNWGLHDMHGNVLEWCDDMGFDNTHKKPDETAYPADGTFRACRGGGFNILPPFCRSSTRHSYDITYFSKERGMRPVLRSVPIPSTAQK